MWRRPGDVRLSLRARARGLKLLELKAMFMLRVRRPWSMRLSDDFDERALELLERKAVLSPPCWRAPILFKPARDEELRRI